MRSFFFPFMTVLGTVVYINVDAQEPPTGIVAGTSGFTALVAAEGSLTTVSGMPTGSTSFPPIVRMNSSGESFYATNNGTGSAYAALISSEGTLQALSGGGLSSVFALLSASYNDDGNGLLGGTTNATEGYLASLSGSTLTQITSGVSLYADVSACSINNSGNGLFGGYDLANDDIYGAQFAGGIATTVFSAESGQVTSASINTDGDGLVGGDVNLAPYVALVPAAGTPVTEVSGLPGAGQITTVAINNDGLSLVGATLSSGNKFYAAYITPEGTVTPISGLPTGNGGVYSVALNLSGDGIIGGFTSSGAYAAFVASDGTLTPISGLPSGSASYIRSVSIRNDGYALIGGKLHTNNPYAALVSPAGVLTILSSLPGSGFISSVSMNQSITTNNFTWIGTDGAQWSTNTNWSTSSVPEAGDSVVFSTTNPPSTSGDHYVYVNTSGINCGSIAFNNPNGGGTAANYIIAGQNSQSLTIDNLGSTATIVVSSSNVAQNTISLPLILQSNLIVTNNATGSLTFSNEVSGSASITNNAGTLVLSGFNIYTGGTTVNGGTLQVYPGGLPRDMNVAVNSPGAMQLFGTGQRRIGTLSGSGAITIDSVTTFVTTSNSSSTFSGAMGGGGIFAKQGTGTLTLSGNNNYTGATFISEGSIQTTAANALPSGGSVNIGASGTLQLGANQSIGDLTGSGMVTVGSGSALSVGAGGISSTFSGAISGAGGLTKISTGTFTLSGTNTYSGTTTVSGGILQINKSSALPFGGSVIVGASGSLLFGQGVNVDINLVINGGTLSVASGTQTLSGTISGTSFSKTGSGTLILSANATMTGDSTVSAGTLTVNGVFGGSGTLTVASGATLKGTGTIAQRGSSVGSIQPGGSIGTLTMSDDWTFESGSNLIIEMDPSTNSLLAQTGNLTIEADSTVFVPANPGLYFFPFSRLVVDADNPITGMFSSATTTLPLVAATVRSGSVWIDFTIIPVASLFPSGNTGAVAHCLDALLAAPCSNFTLVMDALASTPTLEEIEQALLQMQPSAFTSLNVAQENTLLYMNNAIYNRLEHSLKSECSEKKSHLWIGAIGAHTSQNRHNEESGFIANTPGAFLGFDTVLGKRSSVGGGIGYAYTHLSWEDSRGFANMNSAFAGIYGRWATPRVYLQSALLGGYNFYAVNRFIKYGPSDVIDVRAKSHAQGGEGSFNLKTGLLFGSGSQYVISPFGSVDYAIVHRGELNETGAQSLDLKISSQTADLLTSELGADISRYFLDDCNTYNLFIKASVIQETRFMGNHEEAALACGCTMEVDGYNPNRTLAGLGIGFNAVFSDNRLSLAWQGKMNSDYNDFSFHLQYIRGF